MYKIIPEKVVALSGYCLGCYCCRCCPILDQPHSFQLLIVPSNGPKQIDIGLVEFYIIGLFGLLVLYGLLVLFELLTFIQLVIVPSNGPKQIDIGLIDFIQLVPSLQSMCKIIPEKVVALSGSCLGCYYGRCCLILDQPHSFQLLIVQSNGPKQIAIGLIDFIQ